MATALGFFLLGLLLLALGGDSIVKGASGLAQRLGLSPFATGVLLVAYGRPLHKRPTAAEHQLARLDRLAGLGIEDDNRLRLSCFGEAVSQRRAAVAHHAIPGYPLRPVQMAERNVLRTDAKRRRIDRIRAADLNRPLRIRLQTAEHINMAHRQIDRVASIRFAEPRHQPSDPLGIRRPQQRFIRLLAEQLPQP